METKITLFVCSLICIITSAQESVGDQIGVWRIINGQFLSANLASEEDAEYYWQYVNSLFPSDIIIPYVHSLRLYTDGVDGDLAGMNKMDDSNSRWQVDIDVKDVLLDSENRKTILDYTHILIHEFGHVLTLNSRQVKPNEDDYIDESKGLSISEGYAVPGSYFHKFFSAFWTRDMFDESNQINDIEDQVTKENYIDNFYNRYSSQFLTDYAVTNPGEDISESWTFFVMADRPSGTQIKHQKILFFYQFPELEQYRQQIRSKMELIPANYIVSHGKSKY